MKKIKKALMGITALLMAFSVSALCACTPDDNPESGKPEQGAKPVAVKVIDAYKDQTVKGISFTSLTESVVTAKSYACDEKGVKLADAEEQSQKSKSTAHESGKTNADFTNLTADYFTDTKSEALRADGSVDVTQKASHYYSYMFMRGGNIFTYASEETTTDFSKAVLSYQGSIKDALPEGVTIEDALGAMEETGLGSVTSLPVSLILNLSNDFGGVTETSGKVTVDFNKVTYNAYNSVLEVIEGLDENTTVADLIGTKPVKSLVEALTYGIDAKTLYDSVTAEFGGENADASVKEIIKNIPAPEEGNSVYEYIVSLINSKDFAGFIVSSITGQPVSSAIAPFAEFKIADVMALIAQIGGTGTISPSPVAEAESDAGMGMLTTEQIKAMAKAALGEYVSVTEDKFTVSMGYTEIGVSDLKLDFSVNDNYEITELDITGKATTDSLTVRGIGHDGVNSYYANKVTVDMDISYSVYFSVIDLGYEDIDNCNVTSRVEELGEGVYYADSLFCCDYLLRFTVNAEGEITLMELTETYGGTGVGTYNAEEKSVTEGETVVKFNKVSDGYAYLYVNGGSYGADLRIYSKVSDLTKKA